MTRGLISKQYDPSTENSRSGFLTGIPSWTASALALILMLGTLLVVPGCGSNGGGGGSSTDALAYGRFVRRVFQAECVQYIDPAVLHADKKFCYQLF